MKGKIKMLHSLEHDDFCLQFYSYLGLGNPEVFSFQIHFMKSKGRSFNLLSSLRYSYVIDCVEHGVIFFQQIVAFFQDQEFQMIGKYGHFDFDDFNLKFINVAINHKYCECLRYDEVSNQVFSGALPYLFRPEELRSRAFRARISFDKRKGIHTDRRYRENPVVEYWASVSFELS